MKTILVTGASTGIGRATALALAGAGHAVLAGVRREADAPVHDRVQPILLDVANAEHVAALAQRLAGTRLDGLVNNAGIVVSGPLEALTAEDWRRQLDVNVTGLATVTAAALPALRAARGRVVNVGSIGAVVAPPYVTPYVASKGAVRSLSDGLRRELLPLGVKVVLVEPGAIATPIWEKGLEETDALIDGLPPTLRDVYGPGMRGFRRLSQATAAGAASPADVAAVISHALLGRFPRAQVFVGRDAKVNARVTGVLPTWLVDRVAVRLARG